VLVEEAGAGPGVAGGGAQDFRVLEWQGGDERPRPDEAVSEMRMVVGQRVFAALVLLMILLPRRDYG